jgi:hypothetical protein
VYNFLHENIPTVQQLLPIFDNALLNNLDNQNVNITIEENKFLKALNNVPCLSGDCGYNFIAPKQIMVDDNSSYPDKVETRVFAGVGQRTLESIYIDNASSSYDFFYPDGKPDLFSEVRYDNCEGEECNDKKSNTEKFIDWGGDGTVLQKSAELKFLEKEKYFIINSSTKEFDFQEHGRLIEDFKKSIKNFLLNIK